MLRIGTMPIGDSQWKQGTPVNPLHNIVLDFFISNPDKAYTSTEVYDQIIDKSTYDTEFIENKTDAKQMAEAIATGNSLTMYQLVCYQLAYEGHLECRKIDLGTPTVYYRRTSN